MVLSFNTNPSEISLWNLMRTFILIYVCSTKFGLSKPGFQAGVCGKAQLLASGNALEVHGKATAAPEMHHFRENAYLHP